MDNLLRPSLNYLTSWYDDERQGQTLAQLLIEYETEIAQWLRHPERLLVLHDGPFDNLGSGFGIDETSGLEQKLGELSFVKLVLRKNLPQQYDADKSGWHVHAFYPIPRLPLFWSGSEFNYLSKHIAGYFVSGVESEGDGLAALQEDLRLAAFQTPVCSQRLKETTLTVDGPKLASGSSRSLLAGTA